ncbi:MAG: nucleotide exchange factor GrpE [Elusimicrobia bacterium GWA2_69_24]|nr:MAG: nucleotide exchange factor GrpE [Elusimicrobia bacterium GWA2_69_24]
MEPVSEETAAAAPADAAAAESKSLFDQLLRLKADFENYRKRVDREKPALIRHGKRELLERLLPLYDVLLSAHQQVVLQTEQSEDEDREPAVAEMMRGLEMIFGEFTKLFKGEGVTVIETVGKPYDFNRHEVLGQVETDEVPEGGVVDEIQRGYLIDDQTLRPAKVRIAVPVKKA